VEVADLAVYNGSIYGLDGRLRTRPHDGSSPECASTLKRYPDGMRSFPEFPTASLWRASDLPTTDSFVYDLDPDELGPLADAAERLHAQGRNAEEIEAHELPLGPLEPRIEALRRELMEGRGMALLRGFPVDRLSLGAVEILFWKIGLELGTPVSQSVLGERLGHVVDVTDEDPNARGYRNSSELTPHTDLADFLSFLCVRRAKSGGASRFVSALTVHEEIRRDRPDCLELLYRGFRFHRLGEHPPEAAPITPHRVPIFSRCEGLVSCRYISRAPLDIAADEDPEIVLSAEEIEAIDLFEAYAARPDLYVEFTLAPGEAIFANNFTVLHSRRPFEDGATPEQKRHLLRLWMSANPPRPIVPETEVYVGEPGIQAQPGLRPSYAALSKYDREQGLSSK